jgi:hypothetical protein
MPADRRVAARVAECHPDRPYYARGSCQRCYWRERKRAASRRQGASPRPLRKGGVDPLAVDRLIAGDRPERWTVAEMTAAVGLLTAYRYPRRLIADRLRCTRRTVTRHRRLLAAESDAG